MVDPKPLISAVLVFVSAMLEQFMMFVLVEPFWELIGWLVQCKHTGVTDLQLHFSSILGGLWLIPNHSLLQC